MNIILFDENNWQDFLPLTYFRPISELRIGILSLKERWEYLLPNDIISYLTQDYLSKKFKLILSDDNLFINPIFFPNEEIIHHINEIKQGEALISNDEIVIARLSLEDFNSKKFKRININFEGIKFKYPWDLFSHNNHAISYDFNLVTKGRKSQEISDTMRIRGDRNKIFIEEGVIAEYSILNTLEGKIYLGKNSEIMEGSLIRGPLALCEGAKINMGAKIYGGTTIGPYSKIGGEVNNSILIGYSNKGHEGFLGNSVLGEWCNLGADTNISNMKNNYSNVKSWSYKHEKFIDTGLIFSGLIMGDHSKTAINTQFNTGTVVGCYSNIFNAGFLPNLIESFCWGGKKDSEKFKLEKAFDVAERAMIRRNKILNQDDIDIISHLYKNLN